MIQLINQSAHAGYIVTDRSHIHIITHGNAFVEKVSSTGANAGVTQGNYICPHINVAAILEYVGCLHVPRTSLFERKPIAQMSNLSYHFLRCPLQNKTLLFQILLWYL